MNEWIKGYLNNFIKIGNGNVRPGNHGNIPIYGGNGILDYCDSYNYTGETIIIGRVGAYCGSTYYVNRSVWISDNALSIKVVDGDTKFMYYYLKNMNLNMLAEGSTQPLLTHKLINSLEVIIPTQKIQEIIASILSSLDDKIDILRRQNATLESMAEALFRQWFIVEAQDDWEEYTISNFVSNIRNQILPDKGIIYIGLEHVDKKSISLYKSDISDNVSSSKYTFDDGDILFGKLRPYFHKVCFAPYSGVCSTDILVLRPNRKELLGFCLFLLYQSEIIDYVSASSNGTRMPRTDWNTLSSYKIYLPNDDTVIRFSNVCSSYLTKIKDNIKQIHTLEKLRDILLPKLMSGEIRVRCDEES